MAYSIDLAIAARCLAREFGAQLRGSRQAGYRRFAAALEERLGIRESEAARVVDSLEKRELIAWVGAPGLPPCPGMLELCGTWVLRGPDGAPASDPS